MLDPALIQSHEAVIPGLSFAYRFGGDGIPERLNGGDAARALHEHGGWVWLHFALSDADARDFIAGQEGISQRGRAILLSEDEHLRLETTDDGVAGVFADFLRELADGRRAIGRLRFVLTDNLVISGRRDALGGIARTLEAIEQGRRFPHAVALLETIVSHFSDAVGQVAEELAETLDAIEDRLLDDDPRDERRSLVPVRRTAVRLHRQLASLRVLFRRWAGPGSGDLPERIGQAAGRLAQRLDGLDQEIMSLQDRAKLLQDEIAAKLASETNRHLFALSVATVFLLPPTFVVSVFGMNVSGLPFTQGAEGFIFAMLIALGASGAVYAFLRWLRIMR